MIEPSIDSKPIHILISPPTQQYLGLVVRVRRVAHWRVHGSGFVQHGFGVRERVEAMPTVVGAAQTRRAHATERQVELWRRKKRKKKRMQKEEWTDGEIEKRRES
jgi:hypothetical protein